MGNTQTISLSVEPGDFNKVLERVDAIVIEQKSSRSAVMRSILYDYFGIMPQDPAKRLDFSKAVKNARKSEV
jgi:hypothetical protein